MSGKVVFCVGFSGLLISLLVMFNCDLPPDPADPANTSVSMVLITSYGTQDSGTVTDTVGNTIQVGVALHLQQYVDSVSMTITANGETLLDTMFRDFKDAFFDTVWKDVCFDTAGGKNVTITPYSSLNLPLVSALINIVGRPGPENTKPSITVVESLTVKSDETCSLVIVTSDSDTNQTLSITMKDAPEGAEIQDSFFVWTPHESDTGILDTIFFIVEDNGTPPLSDTAWVVIVVTARFKPEITEQPGDTTVTAGESVVFTVTATGTDLQYQWRRKGVDLPDEVSSGLSFDSVTTSDAGVYTVTVCEDVECVVSEEFRLRVLPQIPSRLEATATSASTIDLSWDSAAGALWYRVVRSCEDSDYVAVCSTGAPGLKDSLLVEGCTCSYRIIAGNKDGWSDSGDVATASTWRGPEITTQPQPLTIAVGQPLDLSVAATGDPACTYQWYRDGATLSGMTSPTYTISSAALADSGSYRVVVSNAVRSINSDQVKVTVLSTYSLSTICSPDGGGTIVRSKDTTVYLHGTELTLTATPAEGYRFTGWSGDTTATAATLSIVMKKNLSVKATFIRQYTLTISASTGGTVSPSGSMTVDSGETKDISATASTGYEFTEWSSIGSGVLFGSSTSANTTVRLTGGDVTVQAIFTGLTFSGVINFPGSDSTEFIGVGQMADSGYFIAANVTVSDVIKVAGIKLDPFGDTVWTRDCVDGSARSMRKISTGFLVTNSSMGLLRFAQNGNLIATYFVRGIDIGIGYFGGETDDGGYFVGGSGAGDGCLVKFNAGGDTLWTKYYDNDGGNHSLRDGIQTSDNGYLLIGEHNIGGTCWAVKTNSSGTLSWQRAFTDISWTATGHGAVLSSVQQTDDGGYIIGGNELGGTGLLLKITPDGDVSWYKIFSDMGTVASVRIAADGSGYYLAGNTTTVGPGNSDFYLIKTNTSGTLSWAKAFGTEAGSEYCRAMEIAADGGCIMVGYQSEPDGGNQTGYIVKTDLNGNVK